MLTINTNLSSLIAQQSLKQSTNKLNTAIERMTTGFKINSAKDNAANYSISTNMTTKIGAYQVAEDNAAMGLDLIGTAEGTLSQIQDKLARLRALAEQASNGTYGEQSLNAINTEANAIVDEIERIYSTAEYNGIKLLDQETQMPDDPNIPKAQYDGFIKEVIKRDTSTMTKLSSVDGAVDLADGTYSISTPEEMKKLADMTNAGLISAGDEFVLANDIDLSQYENWTPIGEVWYDGMWGGNWFNGSFDGNGYTISNLTIKNSKYDYVGLFGGVDTETDTVSEIKNLKLTNVDIQLKDREQIAALIGTCTSTNITNCYVTNGNITSTDYAAAGIVGNLGYNCTVDSCYTEDLTVIGGSAVGGIVGALQGTVKNSYSQSKVCGAEDYMAGGIAGFSYTAYAKIINCYSDATNVFGNVFIGRSEDGSLTISDSSYLSIEANPILVNDEKIGGATITNITSLKYEDKKLNLQVGINADENSSISVSTSAKLLGLAYFRNLGISTTMDYLSTIDDILGDISKKQTELGATSNRLESVLDEIQIQHDNLVSSRSTLRDADIAEVSAEYIQQQILQQASATLLATANQSPSIALQLI